MSSSDEIEFDPKLPTIDGTKATSGIAESDAIAQSDAIGHSDAIGEISAAIASGQLDPAAAQQLLIDRVLAEQFPHATDLEPLRAALTELLAEDPVLSQLLSP